MSEENISDAQRKLTEAMQQQANDYARYGQMQVSTSDQLRDAQVQAATGMKNFTAAGGMAGKAIGALAGAGVAAAAEMYKGKKGMGAFNSSLDSLSEAATLAGAALTLLLPGGIIMKAVIGGLTMAATAAIAYTKAANDMADKLYKSYSGLQQSGAAASDGMTGVFNDAKKLGLSMDELDSLVSLVAANSQDLIMFGGTVADGRRQLADMSKAMEGSREGFFKLGISQQAQNEAMAGYMKLSARTGNAQKQTTEQLAASARNYITEQDALARITGMSVKDQQKAREDALMEEQFLAKVRQLQREGKHDEARELQDANVIMSAMGDEVGKGFRATVNGNIRDENARKFQMATQGKGLEASQKLASGQIKAAEAAQMVGQGFQSSLDGQADQLATLGVVGSYMTNYSQMVKGAAMSQSDIAKTLDKSNADQAKTLAGKGDSLTNAQGEMIKTQQEINEKLERAVFKGIPGAQLNMAKLSVATEFLADQFANLTDVLERIPGMGRKKDLVAEKSKEISGTEQKLADAEAAQKTAKTPEEKITADREEKFYKEKLELLKQEKTVVQGEKDLADAKAAVIKRSQDELDLAEAAYNKQLETATTLQKLGFNQDKAQTFAREKRGRAVLKRNQMTVTGGPEQAAAVQAELAKKSGAAPSAAAPSAPAAPSAAAATDKSLAFTGASGSKSNFEQLNPAVKDRVVAAAEQFNAGTGKKITVNSAKRDPADQARLYKETEDAKRPGIGPNGMAVAKPGTSKHEQGLAIDIQNFNDPAAVAAMNQQGLSQTVPKDPVHFTIPSAEEGGIVSGPASGYQTTMHGTEAVIPMQNNSGDFVKMFETMAVQSSRMADMLETLVRAQRDGNDISTKILRQQA
jgi:LAS superfamily LD-carboxypeptidase LdcB